MARVTISGVPGEVGETIRQTLEQRGTLDTAVVGPGEPPGGRFLDTSQEDWSTIIAGLRQAFAAVRDAARRGDRRIVAVSNSAAVRPVHGAALAATAGAFLHTLGQVAAVELGPTGATVNVVVPGFVGDSRFAAATPIGRPTSAEDVAELCAFLASEAAAGVSGAIVPVDGGFTITKSEGGSPLEA
jgi:NAD(P)-dependent dehydrogenase (short-subunit alcohol dehydrogenase family)